LELATLASKGRIQLKISLESFLQEVEARFVVLPISGRACVRAIGPGAPFPGKEQESATPGNSSQWRSNGRFAPVLRVESINKRDKHLRPWAVQNS